MLVPDAERLWRTYAEPIKTWKMGEDGFMFYALHLAAGRENANYTLRHLTWTRSHYLTNRPRRDKRGNGRRDGRRLGNCAARRADYAATRSAERRCRGAPKRAFPWTYRRAPAVGPHGD